MCISDFEVDPGKIKARPRSPMLELLFVIRIQGRIYFRKKSLTKVYVALLPKLKSNLSAHNKDFMGFLDFYG